MIRKPKWVKDAILTTRGWERNGELLKAQKTSQSDVDAYYQLPLELTDPILEPDTEMHLLLSSKSELVEYAEINDVEIKKSWSKSKIRDAIRHANI